MTKITRQSWVNGFMVGFMVSVLIHAIVIEITGGWL